MNVYVLMLDGGECEPYYSCGVYSTLNKAKNAAKQALKDDDTYNFLIKVLSNKGDNNGCLSLIRF